MHIRKKNGGYQFDTDAALVKVMIRRNADGAVRTYPDSFKLILDEEGIERWLVDTLWCDCDAHRFFCHAAGEDEATGEDLCIGCSAGKSRYAAQLVTIEGRVVFSQFQSESPRGSRQSYVLDLRAA